MATSGIKSGQLFTCAFNNYVKFLSHFDLNVIIFAAQRHTHGWGKGVCVTMTVQASSLGGKTDFFFLCELIIYYYNDCILLM